MSKKVVFDTDPGVDDALALLWLASLCHQGHCSLECVTTVAGNVPRDLTYSNAGRLLKAAGLADTTLGKGSQYPGGSESAAHIHGHDGLAGLSELLPAPDVEFEQAPDSVDLLLEHFAAHSPSTSLLAVGPLSNLASAQQRRSDFIREPKEVIVMGGAIAQGNVTDYAEFNIHFDAKAAHTVLERAKNLVLIPLNVTRKLVFSPIHAGHACGANQGIVSQLITQLTEFMTATALERGVSEGFYVHDAATVAYLMHPELITFNQALVSVDHSGSTKNGGTVANFEADPEHCNAWIATDVNADALLYQMCKDLRWLTR